MEKQITLQWMGHSCFRMTCEDYAIVLDPYRDGSVPGCPPLSVSANEVLCSHGHGDHHGVQKVKLMRSALKSPFQITELSSYHDEDKGAQRGENIMRIFAADGLRVAHLGDMGCMPETDQMDQLRHLDAVMVPVGGFFTMEPGMVRSFLKEIAPGVIIPMHYRRGNTGYDAIGTLEDFLHESDPVTRYPDHTIDIVPNMEHQIAVFE